MSAHGDVAAALAAAVVVGPGDRLVISCPRATASEVSALSDAIVKDGSLVGRVLIVTGEVELAVLRGGS